MIRRLALQFGIGVDLRGEDPRRAIGADNLPKVMIGRRSDAFS